MSRSRQLASGEGVAPAKGSSTTRWRVAVVDVKDKTDIQYATAILASRVSKAPELVNELANRLLDYLAYTKNYRLTYKGNGNPNLLEVFTDSSSSRSHGAVAIFYAGGPVTWRSARQAMVTLSTAESELVEGIEGTLMGLSVRDLVTELHGCVPVLQLHVDNQAAIALLQGSSGSWRTRHLRLRSSWFRERASLGEVTIVHEPGDSQRADIGTKPLPKERLLHLVQLWGMKNAGENSPRVSRFSSSPTTTTPMATWLQALVGLCTWCSSQAEILDGSIVRFGGPRDYVAVQICWEFYILVIVVVGLWEVARATWTGRVTRLATLREQARLVMEAEPLTRLELTEFQELLGRDPGTLSLAEAERFLEFRTRFSSQRRTRQRPEPRASRRASALREMAFSLPTRESDEPSASSATPAAPPPPVSTFGQAQEPGDHLPRQVPNELRQFKLHHRQLSLCRRHRPPSFAFSSMMGPSIMFPGEKLFTPTGTVGD